MDVTAILVNYNTAHLLADAIGALRNAAQGVQMQIVIVDNASRDDSVQLIRAEFPDCDFIANDRNVGFGRANNQALAPAKGRYVLLVNTDAFVAPDCLRKSIAYMDAHHDCGVLGVRLVGRDGTLQPACRYFPTPWNVFVERLGLSKFFPSTRLVDDMSWDHATVRECDWVPGCYYLVRKSVIDEVGLFDPRFFLYYEEVDHCRAVKAAGWQVVFYGDTSVVHLGGESAKSDGALTSNSQQLSELQIESELLYFRKHHGRLGVGAAMALASLADVVLALKWALRRRTLAGVMGFLSHCAASWRIGSRGAWGTRPSR